MLVLLWGCAAPKPGGHAPVADTHAHDTSAEVSDAGDAPDTATLCAEADAFEPQYADVVATWTAQDDLSPGPADPLAFVGSSTIRRWEGLAAAYTDHRPVQRGFGGAQLGEIARAAEDLVVRHGPRGAWGLDVSPLTHYGE